MRLLSTIFIVGLMPIPAFADEIVPQDGAWTREMTGVTINDQCPEETKASLLPQFEQSVGQSTVKDIAFGGSFDPALLEDGSRPFGWTQTSDNIWEGAMLGDGDDTEVGAMVLTVESETMISVLTQVELGAMMNPSQDPNFTDMFPSGCAAEMMFEVRHNG